MTVESTWYKKLFKSKIIWKENDRQNLGDVKICNNNKRQSKMLLHYFKLTYQLYKNINIKMNHHTRGKWFIHGPQKNQLLTLEHSYCLSLIYYVNLLWKDPW